MSGSQDNVADLESAVRQRYSLGARRAEADLCCPTQYDGKYLKAIPQEVLERDYGCGDPSRHVCEGETVLDLGSGTGKICFIASQIVGPLGKVVGMDMNDDMLSIARRNAPEVARNIGYSNVDFRKAKIQDLALDLEALELWLNAHPVRSSGDLNAMEAYIEEIKARRPLVENDSIDVVISNCVLNLVEPSAKQSLFAEIYRVLRRGGGPSSPISSATRMFPHICKTIRSCGAAASPGHCARTSSLRPLKKRDSTVFPLSPDSRSLGGRSKALNSGA